MSPTPMEPPKSHGPGAKKGKSGPPRDKVRDVPRFDYTVPQPRDPKSANFVEQIDIPIPLKRFRNVLVSLPQQII